MKKRKRKKHVGTSGRRGWWWSRGVSYLWENVKEKNKVCSRVIFGAAGGVNREPGLTKPNETRWGKKKIGNEKINK